MDPWPTHYTTQYAYDVLDNLLEVTDDAGNVSTMSYDLLGRKTAMHDPDMGDWDYAYDALGNLVGQLDAKGQLLTLSYDTLGRLTGKLSPDTLTTSLYDPFDTKDTTRWTWSSYQIVPFLDGSNNVVKSTGPNIGTWNAHFYRSAYSLADGEGLQLRFKVNSSDTQAHFSIEANDATYRRFGVIADQGKLYVQYTLDGAWVYPADVLPSLQTNTWYVLQIGVDDAGSFSVLAYKESDPSVRGAYSTPTPASARGKAWRFHHWINRNTAYVDDYREFSGPVYRYDAGTNGAGRRTSMSDASGSTAWTYDDRGRVTQESKTISGGGTFKTLLQLRRRRPGAGYDLSWRRGGHDRLQCPGPAQNVDQQSGSHLRRRSNLQCPGPADVGHIWRSQPRLADPVQLLQRRPAAARDAGGYLGLDRQVVGVEVPIRQRGQCGIHQGLSLGGWQPGAPGPGLRLRHPGPVDQRRTPRGQGVGHVQRDLCLQRHRQPDEQGRGELHLSRLRGPAACGPTP